MLLSSIFAGFILRLPLWGDPADDNCFDDEVYWEVSNQYQIGVNVSLLHTNVYLNENTFKVCQKIIFYGHLFLCSCLKMKKVSLQSWNTTTNLLTRILTHVCK